MSASVIIVNLKEPITVIGKTFKGDYNNAQHYIEDVQKELNAASISFIPNKIMGVYYDNPQEKKTTDLTSFHAVFINNEKIKLPHGFSVLELTGKYLYVKIKGEPMKAVYEGYGALFNYIQRNNLQLKSPAGYQVSTFENGEITTEIYMKLS